MKIMICDDNEEIIRKVNGMLQDIYHNSIEIQTTRMPEYILEEWEKHPGQIADIILMDIEYPTVSKNGIEISKEIQKKYPSVKIIFITGRINYANDIFEARPSYFLVKPFDENKLKAAIDKVAEEIRSERKEMLLLKSHGSNVKIPLSEILYIESIGHTMVIHTKGEDETFRMKLKECLELLPEDFWYIHQSYIVHAEYIKKIDRVGIELWDGTRLPIARSKYSDIKNKLLDRIDVP